MQGLVKIDYNGSKFAGQAPDSIEKLIERLQTHRLDPECNAIWKSKIHRNCRTYWGNFVDLSAVFCVNVKIGSELDKKISSLRRRNKALV